MPLFTAAPDSAESDQRTEEVEINIHEDGTIIEADAPQGSDETILSNGILSIQTTGCTYVRISFVKDSGSPVDLRFGYYNSAGDAEGSLYTDVAAGQTVSETWEQINTSGNVTGYMDVPGQQQFNLPPVECD